MIWKKSQRQRQNALWEHLQSIVTFETFGQCLEDAKPDQRAKTKAKTMMNTYEIEVWNCCHYRQLRTWVHDNHCYLTIKSDTGQHSQFLRCFLFLPETRISWSLVSIWDETNGSVNCENETLRKSIENSTFSRHVYFVKKTRFQTISF